MTYHLPYDFSRCPNDACELRKKCLRWLSPGRPEGPQVFTAYPGGSGCYGFISATGEQR